MFEKAHQILRQVASGSSLSVQQAAMVMDDIMSGTWTPAQIGAYMTALHMKKETTAEIIGSATVMRQKAFALPCKRRPLLDVVGSGGDGLHTINVSTLAALVCAGAGATVAKHGNRAMSSLCGAADLLAGLGVAIDISPADAIAGVEENGFGFLFAPHFHRSMQHALAPRREIGLATIFNHLGPLTNPLCAEYQLIGVNRAEHVERFTNVLIGLNCERSLVLHGSGGMDEASLHGPTQMMEQRQGTIRKLQITPQALGLTAAPLEAIQVNSREQSIEAAHALLEGGGSPAHRDMVLLNATLALSLTETNPELPACLERARESLLGGAARTVLKRVVDFTQSHRHPPAESAAPGFSGPTASTSAPTTSPSTHAS